MMKEQIIEILEDIQPEADYETCQTLIDDHILTSLDVLSLVAELEDEFDVTIPTVEIIPSNFNSVDRCQCCPAAHGSPHPLFSKESSEDLCSETTQCLLLLNRPLYFQRQ